MFLRIFKVLAVEAGQRVFAALWPAGHGDSAFRHGADGGPQRLPARITGHFSIGTAKLAALHEQRGSGAAGEDHKAGDDGQSEHVNYIGRLHHSLQAA